MSQGKRFKFNGSSFAVQTALQAGRTISSVTLANPGVVGSANHGFANRDVIKIDVGSASMTELDDQFALVANKATNTYELQGLDTSGYTAFSDGSPSTAIAQRVTFSAFCELTSANQQDAAADLVEVTTICSTAKEFEQGLSDSGTLTLEYNYAGNETVQAALRAAKVAGTTIAFKIVMPGTGGTLIMFGTVQSQSLQGAVNGVWKGSAQIKLSGSIYVLS
jgi:hypothetical protein